MMVCCAESMHICTIELRRFRVGSFEFAAPSRHILMQQNISGLVANTMHCKANQSLGHIHSIDDMHDSIPDDRASAMKQTFLAPHNRDYPV